jgi:hypothetical protein
MLHRVLVKAERQSMSEHVEFEGILNQQQRVMTFGIDRVQPPGSLLLSTILTANARGISVWCSA